MKALVRLRPSDAARSSEGTVVGVPSAAKAVVCSLMLQELQASAVKALVRPFDAARASEGSVICTWGAGVMNGISRNLLFLSLASGCMFFMQPFQ